jgi:hypothetical protein
MRCPELSLLEWHPFAISSSPHDDFIRFSISACGDWTRSLFALFASHQMTRSYARQDFEKENRGEKKKLPRAPSDLMTRIIELKGPLKAQGGPRGRRKMRQQPISKENSELAASTHTMLASSITQSMPPFPVIEVDGPYGAPAQDFVRYKAL